MWRAMFRDTSAAPSFFASNGDTCLYIVPTRARSSLSSTGAEIAPGTWSSAYSAGERTSMTASNWARSPADIATTGLGAGFTGPFYARGFNVDSLREPAHHLPPTSFG